MKDNKPDIRFEGFEEAWEEKQLKDLVNYSSTGIRVCDSDNSGKYELYDANEVIGKINSFVSDSSFISIIKDGSGVGRVRLMPGYTSCIGTMGCLTSKDDNDINFIFSKLQTKDFSKHIISGAIPHVYFRDFGEDNTNVPKPKEQEKVGEFFRNLDELIEAKEQELEKLRHIKLALLDKMFPCDEPDNTNWGGYNRLINSELLMQNNLQIFPSKPNTPAIRFCGFSEPWKKESLSKLITFGKGKGYSKNCITKAGTPIILYGLLYTNYHTNIFSSTLYSKMYEWSVLSKGFEVIVPASGETAEDIARASAILSKGIILGGDINILYPNNDINSSFLALELTYGQTHRELVKKAQGISVVHIHNSDIEELSICFPSYSEQKKIGEFFKEQDDNIANAQLQVIKLRNIKQALMEKMFA